MGYSSGGAGTAVSLGNLGSTEVIAPVMNEVVRGTLDANCAISYGTVSTGLQWTVELTQDVTGNRTVTWSGVTWVDGSGGAVAPTASAVSVYDFYSPDGSAICGLSRTFPVAADSVLEVPGTRGLYADARGLSTGWLEATMFTPEVDFVVSNIINPCLGTLMAGATLAKMGLHTVSGNDLTCIARTQNDTGMWGALTYAAGTKPIYDNGAASPSLISNVTLRAGRRYAVSALFVGTTAPQLAGRGLAQGIISPGPTGALRIAGEIGSQTDIPATVTVSGNPTSLFWFGLS